jgi:hypothetical protein
MAGERFVLEYALNIDLSPTRNQINKFVAEIQSLNSTISVPNLPKIPALQLPAGSEVDALARQLAQVSVIFRENIEAGLRASGLSQAQARSAPESLAVQEQVLQQGRTAILSSGINPSEIAAATAQLEKLFVNLERAGFGAVTKIANAGNLGRPEAATVYTADVLAKQQADKPTQAAKVKEAKAAEREALATEKAAQKEEARAAARAAAEDPAEILRKNAAKAAANVQARLDQLNQVGAVVPENLQPSGTVIGDQARVKVLNQQIKEEVEKEALLLRQQNAQIEAQRIAEDPAYAAKVAEERQKQLAALAEDYTRRRTYAIEQGSAEQKAFNEFLDHNTQLQRLYGEEEAARGIH